MVTRPGYVQIMVTSGIVKNMTVNAEAVMAMMRKELQDQRKIFHYFFFFFFNFFIITIVIIFALQ